MQKLNSTAERIAMVLELRIKSIKSKEKENAYLMFKGELSQSRGMRKIWGKNHRARRIAPMGNSWERAIGELRVAN